MLWSELRILSTWSLHQLSRGLSPSPLGVPRTGLSEAHSSSVICTGQSDLTLRNRILSAARAPPRAAQLSVVYRRFTPHLESPPPRPSLLGLRRTLPTPSATAPMQFCVHVWSLYFCPCAGCVATLPPDSSSRGNRDPEHRVMGTQRTSCSPPCRSVC